MKDPQTTIIGAGPAGLTLGLALHQRGHRCRIFDGAIGLNEAGGHYFTVSPEALSILSKIGVKVASIEAEGTTVRGLFIFDGECQQRIPLAEFDGFHHTNITRPTFMTILADAADRSGLNINWARSVESVSVSSDSAHTKIVVDGQEIEGRTVIGCDGLRSVTRRAIVSGGHDEAIFQQVVLYASVSTALPSYERGTPLERNVLHFIRSPSGTGTLGVLPTRNETFWFARLNLPPTAATGTASTDSWRSAIVGIDARLGAELAELTDRIAVINAFDIPTLPTWSKGPLHIIGDAAHGMSPAAGRGATLAIQDALLVSDCLTNSSDLRSRLDERRLQLAAAPSLRG
jgi:2-polyprenyl-6-methoxyphenol hydroxylase-like FAD-dependent oxidoreductase